MQEIATTDARGRRGSLGSDPRSGEEGAGVIEAGVNAPSGASGAIGEFLRRWRGERGVSRRALAGRAGVAVSTLARWETGANVPSLGEWEAVLRALGLSPDQITASLALLPAPRAVRRLQDATAPATPARERPANGGDTKRASGGVTPGGGEKPGAREPFLHRVAAVPSRALAPPVGGDLLRAMRLRRGVTQSDLASRLGVPQSAVARWERSEGWPDAPRLHALCYELGARAEELSALTVGRFSLGSLLTATDPDALHQEQWSLRGSPSTPSEDALRDLRFLALEARMHTLLGGGPPGDSGGTTTAVRSRLQRLLSWTYSRHAQYLMETGRVGEAQAPARNAMIVHRPLWPAHNDEGWVPALFAEAAGLTPDADSSGGRLTLASRTSVTATLALFPPPEQTDRAGRATRSAYRRAAERLNQSLGDVKTPVYHGWTLSVMAKYATLGGLAEEAVVWSEAAVRIMETSDAGRNRTDARFRRRDHAGILLACGRAREAADYLSSEPWDNPTDNLRDLLTRASVLTALGDRTGADDALAGSRALLAALTLSHGGAARSVPEWLAPLQAIADRLGESV